MADHRAKSATVSLRDAMTTHILLSRLKAYLDARGLDIEEYLAACRLPRDAWRVSDRFFRLEPMFSVFDHAARELGEPALGVRISLQGDPSAYGLMGFVLRYAPTPLEALNSISEWVPSMWPGLGFEVVRDDTSLAIRLSTSEPVVGQDILFQEILTKCFIQVASCADGSMRALSLSLHSAPCDPSIFEDVFGVTPRFDQDFSQIVVPLEVAQRPSPHADAALYGHLLEGLRCQLELRARVSGEKRMVVGLQGCVIDLIRGTVIRNNETTTLTKRERQLLQYFARRPNEVVAAADLERDVWGLSGSVVTSAPAVAVRRLRRKIEPEGGRPVNLVTVFGDGWRLVVPGQGLDGNPLGTD